MEFEVGDEIHRVEARRGVVLATGGFDWDPELVRSFIRGPLERSVAVETNTGDGLKMAMRIGAALGNMREAWWVPIMDVSDGDDPDFGRGRSVNDRWWGDAQRQGVDATLGPIETGPFYAVELHPARSAPKVGRAPPPTVR